MAKDKSIWTVGRRKTAVARVKCIPGTGKIIVNDRTVANFFPVRTYQIRVKEPLRVTDSENRFDFHVYVHGGGVSAQAGAVSLGIARALVMSDTANRPSLRHAGHLTRDPREVERKKYGHKKARKSFQYSKR